MGSDPVTIADEVVYGVGWDRTSDDEFHPECNRGMLHDAVAQAIRDAYERAAQTVDAIHEACQPWQDKHLLRSAADAIRALKGEG